MGQYVSRSDYIWTYTEQPHSDRRRKIVKAHPEIKQLFGVDPSLKYVVTSCVLAQIVACYLLRESSWLLILLQAYFFGGVVNHGLTLAIHDISHNTAVKSPIGNRLFGMIANLPIGVPMSISFKKYHVEHHRYLGEDALDTDVPTEFEAKLFTTPARKLLWLLLQPLFYAFRPLVIYKKYPSDMEMVNAIIQISFDLAVVHFCGLRSLAYLLLGTLLAMGMHPSAGHFVAEHYVFKEDQETYSYYGPWNLVLYNVGYHVEHHDFPYIPGRLLPKVRQIAPEFYCDLHVHESWLDVLYQFVVNPAIGPYTRMKRPASVPQERYYNNMLIKPVSEWIRRLGKGCQSFITTLLLSSSSKLYKAKYK